MRTHLEHHNRDVGLNCGVQLGKAPRAAQHGVSEHQHNHVRCPHGVEQFAQVGQVVGVQVHLFVLDAQPTD